MDCRFPQFDAVPKRLLGCVPKAFFPFSPAIYGPFIALPPCIDPHPFAGRDAISPLPARVRHQFITGQHSEREAIGKKESPQKNRAMTESAVFWGFASASGCSHDPCNGVFRCGPQSWWSIWIPHHPTIFGTSGSCSRHRPMCRKKERYRCTVGCQVCEGWRGARPLSSTPIERRRI